MRIAYLKSAGSISETARVGNTSRITARRLIKSLNWKADLDEVQEEAVAEAKAAAAAEMASELDTINEYLKVQHGFIIENRIMCTVNTELGFDVRGYCDAVKLKQLLEGRATERIDAMADDLTEQFMRLAPAMRERVISNILKRAGDDDNTP